MGKKNCLILISVACMIFFATLSRSPVQVVVNPNIQVGDVLLYKTLLKVTVQGSLAQGTDYTKYIIIEINSTTPNVDSVCADVYFSENYAESFSTPDR